MQTNIILYPISSIHDEFEDGLDFYLYLQNSLVFNFWQNSEKDTLNDSQYKKKNSA